jgi:hypothetical protein
MTCKTETGWYFMYTKIRFVLLYKQDDKIDKKNANLFLTLTIKITRCNITTVCTKFAKSVGWIEDE